MKLIKLIQKTPQQNSSTELGIDKLADVELAEFDIVIAKKINVLLIGRSGVGKSSFVASMLFPFHGGVKSGFSDTKLPYCYSLVLFDHNSSRENLHQIPDEIEFIESNIDQLEKLKYSYECYQLNIIDTPGLSEVDSKGNEKVRTDDQIMDIIDCCLKLDVSGFNLICYVSEGGKTQQMDVNIFKKLQSFFGTAFAEISLMLITHGDKFSFEDQQRIKKEILDHPNSKEVASYCKLGIYFSGSLCATEIISYPTPEIRELNVRDNLKRINEMRKTLLDLFFRHSGTKHMLTHKVFTGFVEKHEIARKKVIEQVVRPNIFWKWVGSYMLYLFGLEKRRG